MAILCRLTHWYHTISHWTTTHHTIVASQEWWRNQMCGYVQQNEGVCTHMFVLRHPSPLHSVQTSSMSIALQKLPEMLQVKPSSSETVLLLLLLVLVIEVQRTKFLRSPKGAGDTGKSEATSHHFARCESTILEEGSKKSWSQRTAKSNIEISNTMLKCICQIQSAKSNWRIQIENTKWKLPK